MKLRRIEMENFRAFAVPLEVEVDDFTAFIGRNDIGKSSILAALTIFLEGDGVKIEQDDGCLEGNGASVRITCEFDELPTKIILDDQYETSLKAEHLLRSNGRIRITKVFDCTKSKIAPSILINTENHPVDKDGKSLLPLTLTDLKKFAAEAKVELEVGEATVKAKIRKAIVERSNAFTIAPVDVPVGKNDSQTLWDQLLKHLPLCALFVSDRASSEKDKEAQTPMGIAVEAALADVQMDLEKLAKHVEKQVQEVADRTMAKLKEMNSELASELTASLKEKPKWRDLFKYTLTSSKGVPMDKRGSGVRRLVLLNFFRAEAERKAATHGGRPVIYAVEEPETSQHPDHQRMLVRALMEIAEKGGQVIITTHAPGLAGEVSVDSLRFIDDRDGKLIVRSAATEEPTVLFSALAERLGMLPDNQVRVLICVEGVNDARFLKHVSQTLHAADPDLPDLSRDHRFVFIPMHGGNLRDVVNQHLFRNFRKPEFHIYDRDDGGTYATQEAEVKARADGSVAIQTQKRFMESYIHPAAIERVTGVRLDVKDDEDFTPKFGSLVKAKKSEAKFILAEKVAPAMTIDEIDGRDTNKEIRGWLAQLANMAEQ